MSDRLEEIKNKPRDYVIRNDRSWVTMERDEFLSLIQEIERLQGEVERLNHWTTSGAAIRCGVLEEEIESLQSQLAEVAKERDELKEDKETPWYKCSQEKLGRAESYIKELEAENAELRKPREQIESMEKRYLIIKAERDSLKKEIAKLKERETIIKKAHKSMYENMEDLPYDVSKLIDENFWELF